MILAGQDLKNPWIQHDIPWYLFHFGFSASAPRWSFQNPHLGLKLLDPATYSHPWPAQVWAFQDCQSMPGGETFERRGSAQDRRMVTKGHSKKGRRTHGRMMSHAWSCWKETREWGDDTKDISSYLKIMLFTHPSSCGLPKQKRRPSLGMSILYHALNTWQTHRTSIFQTFQQLVQAICWKIESADNLHQSASPLLHLSFFLIASPFRILEATTRDISAKMVPHFWAVPVTSQLVNLLK